jgi:hypothetical protein
MMHSQFWLCTDLETVRANLDKTDAEIAEMFPGRTSCAILSLRVKYRMMKCPQRAPKHPRYIGYPQADRGIQPVTDMVHSR